MFGHDSQPTRNFAFGAFAPEVNLDLFWQQAQGMHRYRNKLCELERQRREASLDAVRQHCPEVASLEAQVANLEEALAAARAAIKGENRQARSKAASPLQKGEAAQIRAMLAERRAELRQVKKDAFAAGGALAVRLEAIEAEYQSRARQERGASGLYWGNYLAIEQSCQSFRKGAPPEFARWREQKSWRIAVQIQGGLSVADAFAGTDTRLRITRLPERSQALVALRIGSTGRGGREPIWCQFCVVLSRDLPADGQIKWAYLHARRESNKLLPGWQKEPPGFDPQHDRSRLVWTLTLSVARAEGYSLPDAASTGMVGIDLNWRLLPTGLRVASAVGSDGVVEHLLLPSNRIAQWRTLRTLAQRRSQMRDAIVPRLCQWLGEHEAILPEWLRLVLPSLHLWRSTARLSALLLHWLRDARFPGDESIVEELRGWRKQNEHLQNWEDGLRPQLVRWRDDVYRNWVVRLRRKYHTACIENTNWQDLARLPEPESDEAVLEGPRYYQKVAAVGRLAQLIREGFAAYQMVDASKTTVLCHACGREALQEEFDPMHDLEHACVGCGALWDQDVNAARNILARGETAM